jgi:hypothetical protein
MTTTRSAEFFWILRLDKFDPHRPYQLSLSLHRTCQNREAAKGSNKSENALVSKYFWVARVALTGASF